MDKQIIFEKMRLVHLPLVLCYLWRKRHVSAFDFDHDTKRSRILRKLVNSGRVERFLPFTPRPIHHEAIEQTEHILASLKPGLLRRAMRDLYQTDQVDLVFKKCLVTDVFRTIFIDTTLENLAHSQNGKTEIIFWGECFEATKRLLERHGSYRFRSPALVRMPLGSLIISWPARVWRRISYWLVRWLFIVLRIIAMCLGAIRPGKPSRRQKYRYAIPLDTEFHLRFEGKRRFDFLVDGQKIRPEDTVFLARVPLTPGARSQCKQRKLNVMDLPSALSLRSLLRSSCSRVHVLAAAKALLKTMPVGPNAFIGAAFQCLNVFIEQAVMDCHVEFDHYIYTNQESQKQVAMNILLGGRGVQTWNYASFIGGAYIYARNREFRNVQNILWSFLNSTHSVVSTAVAEEYYRLHRQTVRFYHDLGAIYSELIREYVTEPGKDALASELLSERTTPPGRKIVAIFDTTFIDSPHTHTTYDDALAFYCDVIRLIDELPEIIAIIKPSKPEQFYINPSSCWSSPEKGLKLMELWDRIKGHQRVHWAGISGDVSQVIAASDLTITHCLSSPTFDAVCAGRRGFWYESGRHHEGLEFDSIPGMVIHGYDHLLRRTRELLFETTDEQYREYLETYVRGKLESYLDGRALSRFRRLLCGENETMPG